MKSASDMIYLQRRCEEGGCSDGSSGLRLVNDPGRSGDACLFDSSGVFGFSCYNPGRFGCQKLKGTQTERGGVRRYLCERAQTETY